jgi:uncharacterized protein involved in exopolysaccharide biosynthesis
MSETPAPTHSPKPATDAPDELSLADIVRFFRRSWRLIVGAAAVAAIGTAIVLLALGREYGAVATLVIVPPTVRSDLKPPTLSVQSYQEILESDEVIGEARKKLLGEGAIPAGSLLRLGHELETRIFVSRRAENTALAPMLQAVAHGDTGEQAAAIANTWAAVFVERAHELMAGTTSATVQFVEQQYPQVRDSLTKLENTRLATADDLQRKYDKTAMEWDQKVTAFGNETTAKMAEYNTETKKLTEEYMSTQSLDSRKAQLDALRKAYSDLQDEQARVTSQLQLKQLQLDAARKQLAETPSVVTLQKAITDDALWRAVADSKTGTPDWKAIQGRTLSTQEVNPTYTALTAKVADIEMDVNSMAPRAKSLAADLQRLDGEMKTLETVYRSDNAGLDKLTRERQAGLDQLQAQRDNRLAELKRLSQSQLDGLKRESDMRLAQLDRTIAQRRDLFSDLEKNYNQALLAKAQENMEDVRLAAAAVPPQVPEGRGFLVKTLAAAIIGGLLGFLLCLIRESLG